MHHTRLGVSTVIAELMMLAIVVGLGTVVYAFSSAAFGNFGSGFSFLVSNSGDQLQEQFAVEQVAFTTCPGATGQACIYVRNVGSLVVTVSSVYVYDVTTGKFIGSASENVRILVGAFAPVPVGITGFTVSPGDTYRFVVASLRGNSVVVNQVA